MPGGGGGSVAGGGGIEPRGRLSDIGSSLGWYSVYLYRGVGAGLKFFPRPIIVGFTPFGFTVCTLAIDYVPGTSILIWYQSATKLNNSLMCKYCVWYGTAAVRA